MSAVLRPDQWWSWYCIDPQGVGVVLGCGSFADRLWVFECGAAMMCGQQLGDMLGVPVASAAQARSLIWLVRDPVVSPIGEVAAELGVDEDWLDARLVASGLWRVGEVLASQLSVTQTSGVNVLGVPQVDRRVAVDAVYTRDVVTVSVLVGWPVEAVKFVMSVLLP